MDRENDDYCKHGKFEHRERNLSGNKPTQPAPVQKVGQIGSGVIANGSAIVHTPSAADKVEETSLGSLGLPVTAPPFRPSTVASLSAVSEVCMFWTTRSQGQLLRHELLSSPSTAS